MKKWMIILAGALTASLVLVACGQKKEEPTSTSSSSKVSSTSSTSSKKSEKSAGLTDMSGGGKSGRFGFQHPRACGHFQFGYAGDSFWGFF